MTPPPVTPPAQAPAPPQHPPTSAPAAPAEPSAPSLGEVSATAGECPQLDGALSGAARMGASDMHFHPGLPMKVRTHGRLHDFGQDRLENSFIEGLLYAALNPAQRRLLDDAGQVDFAHSIDGIGRFRGNIYRGSTGLNGVFRFIPGFIPSLSQLGLPSDLSRVTTFHQGLVLVTGPAGCGKSTTLASLVNIINEERNDHVLTIEDPVEYLHTSKRCLVNQREVKRHTQSFARALRAALREDPDVIVIGELRDLETISLAITAAETGHLVLGTLHTGSAIRTINRLVGAFPPEEQPQIRTMISESLRAVISQRLVERTDGQGRVPALEILTVNKAVSNVIREGRTFQLRSALQTGRTQGQLLLDVALGELVKSGTVTREEALRHAEDPRLVG
jgi:twitching motility protein PilT